jgi:hypothetical protein
VDGAMLQSLTENFEYLVVYFCKSNWSMMNISMNENHTSWI